MFLSLAWKEISRRRGRTLLSMLGFLLVALLLAASLCLGDAIRRATTEPLKVTGADLVVIKRVIPCAFAEVKRPKDLGAISMAQVQRIGALDGVLSASGSLVVWAFHDNQPTVVTGVVPGSLKSGPLRQYRSGERCCVLEEGRFFELHETDAAILDRDFAERQGVSLGDTVWLGPRQFRTVGILKVAGVALIGGGEAYVPLAVLQDMLGEGAVVVYVFVTAETKADIGRIEQQIHEIIGEGCQVSTQKSLPGQVSRSAAVTAAGAGVFVALVLIVGGLLMARSALASIRERIAEIGILRAVGWRKRHVIQLIGIEMTLQGLAGALPGVALGYGIAFLACTHLNLSLPGSFDSYPPCSITEPALQLALVPRVQIGALTLTLVLTVAVALAAGVIAGRQAAAKAPMDTLRQP